MSLTCWKTILHEEAFHQWQFQQYIQPVCFQKPWLEMSSFLDEIGIDAMGNLVCLQLKNHKKIRYTYPNIRFYYTSFINITYILLALTSIIAKSHYYASPQWHKITTVLMIRMEHKLLSHQVDSWILTQVWSRHYDLRSIYTSL